MDDPKLNKNKLPSVGQRRRHHQHHARATWQSHMMCTHMIGWWEIYRRRRVGERRGAHGKHTKTCVKWWKHVNRINKWTRVLKTKWHKGNTNNREKYINPFFEYILKKKETCCWIYEAVPDFWFWFLETFRRSLNTYIQTNWL